MFLANSNLVLPPTYLKYFCWICIDALQFSFGKLQVKNSEYAILMPAWTAMLEESFCFEVLVFNAIVVSAYMAINYSSLKVSSWFCNCSGCVLTMQNSPSELHEVQILGEKGGLERVLRIFIFDLRIWVKHIPLYFMHQWTQKTETFFRNRILILQHVLFRS